jgi:hypothetical protein
MRARATRLDLAVVALFFLALLAILAVFLAPIVVTLIHHVPDLIARP